MAGVRDDDYLVRASSLSNLAEVCRLLRYSLGPIVSEIVNCADCVLRYDPAIEPRRAAALLLRMIIEGGDSEILDVRKYTIYVAFLEEWQYLKKKKNYPERVLFV